MKFMLILLFCSALPCSYAQIYGDMEIAEESQITPWHSSDISAYAGVYYFGFSEGESKLLITISNGIICAQLSYYDAEIYENGQFMGWRKTFKNYTNVSIKGDKFYSDQSNGAFVNLIIEGKSISGLRLDKAPFIYEAGQYEIGGKGALNMIDNFNGEYAGASYKIISEAELEQLTGHQLQIMRNEIYARYGYTFIDGGKMATYFKEQEWYRATESNVDEWITEIEKINIETIQKIESR